MNNEPELYGGEGFVGNLYISPQPMGKTGDEIGGHTHYFDHVGFLGKGSVEVHVEGYETKRFDAPTFVVIRKHRRHRIVALENDTRWYCVFAVRDVDGNPTEIVNGQIDPWFIDVAGDYWEHHDPQEQATKESTIPFLESPGWNTVRKYR
jgi:hypothetical protein